MKTKLYLLFFFVFPLFMSACRGDDPIPDPPVDGKRTVLVLALRMGIWRN